MSNYQYRAADKGLYGPVTMENPVEKSWKGRLFQDYWDACSDFNKHLESLPRVASVTSCEWKDGEIVEEGKDFRFQEIEDGENGPDGQPMYGGYMVIAVPISGGERINGEIENDRMRPKEEETKPTDVLKWVNKKPEFNRECTFVTRNVYRRNSEPLEYEYNVWQIKKLDGETESGEPAWYWGLLNGDGEEWGDLDDLRADWYLILPPEAATPSVDASKETFSRNQFEKFAEWLREMKYTTHQLLDEYLNELNKQK